MQCEFEREREKEREGETSGMEKIKEVGEGNRTAVGRGELQFSVARPLIEGLSHVTFGEEHSRQREE